MSHNLLALASTANEAAIAYREAGANMLPHVNADAVRAANKLAEAVDALTSAVAEHVNEAAIEIPRGRLTRIAEIEDVAFDLGKTIPEAIVWLVNERLSGSYRDGYHAGLDDLAKTIGRAK